MSRIYVASSWRNELQPSVVQALRDNGHEVYDFRNPPGGDPGFSWREIAPDWEQWSTDQYVAALSHEAAERGFLNDFQGMLWADTCVMVLPCGRSANLEAGWFWGHGRRLFVYQPVRCEPELMYKGAQGIFSAFSDLIEALARPTYQPCTICNGTGAVRLPVHRADLGWEYEARGCRVCQGSGLELVRS